MTPARLLAGLVFVAMLVSACELRVIVERDESVTSDSVTNEAVWER